MKDYFYLGTLAKTIFFSPILSTRPSISKSGIRNFTYLILRLLQEEVLKFKVLETI